VVREGESARVLAWYRAACGMQRFLCTATESPEEGTVIADDVGLRWEKVVVAKLHQGKVV